MIGARQRPDREAPIVSATDQTANIKPRPPRAGPVAPAGPPLTAGRSVLTPLVKDFGLFSADGPISPGMVSAIRDLRR